MPNTGLGMRDVKMNKTLSLTSRSTVRKGKKPCSAKKLKPQYCICCYSGWPCPQCTSGRTSASGNSSHIVGSCSLGPLYYAVYLAKDINKAIQRMSTGLEAGDLKPQGEDKRKGMAKTQIPGSECVSTTSSGVSWSLRALHPGAKGFRKKEMWARYLLILTTTVL